ncbi:MAG: hypothetical protein WEF50_21910 [Myxococcota bacterium]
MVATKWLGRAAIVAGLLAFSTPGAQALTLNVIGGGLEADNANYGCPTAPGTCSVAARDYLLTSDALATGTININAAGDIIDIELHVAGATFTGTGGPITFGPVTYLATLSGPSVSTTPVGPGTGGIDSGFGTGSVSGDVNGSPFAVVAAAVSITCEYPGGTGQCGISFGESGFTNVEGRDWRHTFNVSVQALPEPTAGLLVVLGLTALALRLRRS